MTGHTSHQHDDSAGTMPGGADAARAPRSADTSAAPAAGGPPARPRRTGPAADAGGTVVRHVRVRRGAWRAAAARASREGYGVAELVARLVEAYGAGELEAPARADRTGDRIELEAPGRTSVRGVSRESNGCSTDPAGASAHAPARATTSVDHQKGARR